MADEFWEDMAKEVMEGKRKLEDFFCEKTRLSIEAVVKKLEAEKKEN